MSHASQPGDSPCERLRSALRARLSRELRPVPPASGFTPETLEQAWRADPNGYGYAGAALASLDGAHAAALLGRMLDHPGELSSLEAAAGLAVLGERDGLARLQNVRVLTNSQIEYFLARAALTLLGEPIPAALQGKRSVFSELEALVDAAASCKVPSRTGQR